jgi:hypothetical protein
MNNQSKAYSIILYLIWPFSALFIGIKNFDSRFGKNLFVALYGFLGFTAISIGDLQRYESGFYKNETATFSFIITELISLQTGKFYNSFIEVVIGSIFDSHHYYFLFLFLVYGYFYISTIHLLKEISLKKLNVFGIIFFFGLFLFLLIRPLSSLAFYTGGIFILYNIVSYCQFKEKKYLWFTLLAPLFHIGLTIYLILPLLVLLFKNKTWYYVFFVFFTFAIGQSNVTGLIEDMATSNSGTIIDTKFKAYASEKGQKALDERYATKELSHNTSLKSFDFIQDGIWYFLVPLGVGLIFLKRKYLLFEKKMFRLLHAVLLFWGISNLMLNISQGERFLVLFSFIAIGLFFLVYIKTKDLANKTIFGTFIYIFVPILFLFGLMAAYASNPLFAVTFFISNFFIEIFNLHWV